MERGTIIRFLIFLSGVSCNTLDAFTVRVVPSVVYDFKSDAEKKLHRLLSKMKGSSGAVALHSQNLPEHSYKEWCEIDYVLITPRGILVLELKGGRVERSDDGIWKFKDRFGKVHTKSEGPFDQAKSGMYALKDALEHSLGRSKLAHVSFGWGCVFPDTIHVPHLTETTSDTIIAAKECKTAETLSIALRKLSDYWFSKKARHRDLSATEIQSIHMALRPSFEITPALATKVDSIFQKMVSLTQGQYMIVDAADESQRILCSGGAGTGKSLVAMEVARREANKGKRVAFISSGALFGAYVKETLAPSGVTFVELKPSGRKLLLNKGETFDCIIVDEAQDMMNWGLLDVFSAILKDGFEAGNWHLFLDPNNQRGVLGSYEEDAFEYARGISDHAVKLKRNCRNTPQIITQTQMLTGADIGVSQLDGQGEKVRIRTYENSEALANLLIEQLNEWQRDGVDLRDVTLLSAEAVDESILSILRGKWSGRLYILNRDTVNARPLNKIAVSDIRSFKGLESKYIIVLGLDRFENEPSHIRSIYIGLTRANAILSLFIPREKQPIIDELYLAYLETAQT